MRQIHCFQDHSYRCLLLPFHIHLVEWGLHQMAVSFFLAHQGVANLVPTLLVLAQKISVHTIPRQLAFDFALSSSPSSALPPTHRFFGSRSVFSNLRKMQQH